MPLQHSYNKLDSELLEKNSFMFLSKVNWGLLLFTLAIIAAGLLNMSSTSAVYNGNIITHEPFFQRQVIWVGAGLVVMFVISFIDYKYYEFIGYPFYAAVLILLILVPIMGVSAGGAKRWLNVGFMNIQPSEFAKLSILILGAKFLAKDGAALSWWGLIRVSLIVAIPFVLVVTQPDLGTSLVLLFILGGMVLFHGIQWRVFRILLLVVPCIMPFVWFALKDYQRQRILTFLDPTIDPQGAGYNIIQSQIAIGSGQFLGKGFHSGTQNQLQFLPEKHTDFAIAVFAEEWGFVGIFILLCLFSVFLYSIYLGARDAKDRFGSLLCAGIFFYFFLQVLINIGMVIGIMPVVGMPLPFISYGGSSMLLNCFFIGIVFNVYAHRSIYKNI